MDKIKQEYDNLVDEINKYDLYYYEYANPLISDFEFDKLYKKLEEFEEKYPEIIRKDSRTQRVGIKPISDLPSIKHEIKMLSLDNSYSINDLLDFINRVKKNTDKDFSLVFEPKIDGAAISLIYENGVLVKGITRGDGQIGEDVTHNIRTIKNLPEQIDFKGKLILRGEVYLKKTVFEKLNQDREINNLQIFANPRNTAAGSLKLKDPYLCSLRNLDTFVYSIAYGKQNKTHYEDLLFLKELGFPVNLPKVIKGISDKEKLEKIITEFYELKNDIDYEIDGIVIKVNEYDIRDEIGETIKYPKWAIAYKFPAEQAVTTIKNVRFQVGRTGVLTPVADLKPVQIAGSTVSHATLHNLDEISRLKVKINDKVFIEKSGEIIPKIISVLKDKRDGNEKEIIIPSNCPACDSKLIMEDGGVNLICTNKDCPAILKASILHMVSRNALDIKGLGEKVVEKFMEVKIIQKVADIFYLENKYDEIVSLEGFGKKSAENIIKAIEESKGKPFYKLLFSLGIRHIGIKTSEILTNRYRNIEQLKQATYEELVEIEEIGEVIAKSLYNAMRDEYFSNLINVMQSVGYKFESNMQKEITNKLDNITFVITGTLSKPRKEIEEIIKQNGGKILSSVSKKLNYLLVGENAGSKLKKAKDLGVKIITEQDFNNIING